MPKESTPNTAVLPEISQRMLGYATEVAGWQLDEAEQDMLKHPDRYAEYANARECMASAENALIEKLGGDQMALEAFSNASNAYAAALAIELYLRGVMDGGRMYHAFTTRELPRKGETK